MTAAPNPHPSHASVYPDTNPLGMTAERYADLCRDLGVRGRTPWALLRYRQLFQTGTAADPLLTPWHTESFTTDTHPTTTSPWWLPPVVRTHRSESAEGTVVKFAQRVRGRAAADPDLETESVLIPMIGKKGRRTYTVCVSSQVGCAMGCTFCQTAQMGLIRSLTAAEIVAQWFAARHVVLPDPAHGLDPDAAITNIVFMGMGEPLDNLDAVLDAIEVLTDPRGGCVPMSKVTISTVGRLDGIRRVNEKVRQHGWHRLGFAVSLNAPNDAIRSTIMPINRAMPMQALRDALLGRDIKGGFKFCFEYVLIPSVNDAREHAAQIADFVLGRGEYTGQERLEGLVNLIPYNPRDGSPWPAPEEPKVDEFLAWLTEEGVYAKRRRTKGRNTMAACGQLGNPALRRKPRPAITIERARID